MFSEVSQKLFRLPFSNLEGFDLLKIYARKSKQVKADTFDTQGSSRFEQLQCVRCFTCSAPFQKTVPAC